MGFELDSELEENCDNKNTKKPTKPCNKSVGTAKTSGKKRI